MVLEAHDNNTGQEKQTCKELGSDNQACTWGSEVNGLLKTRCVNYVYTKLRYPMCTALTDASPRPAAHNTSWLYILAGVGLYAVYSSLSTVNCI